VGHYPIDSECKQQFHGSKIGNTCLYDVLTLETKRLLKQGQQWSLIWKKNGVFGENVNRETERGEKGVVDYKERSEKPGGGYESVGESELH
jgi:hypothetical protein